LKYTPDAQFCQIQGEKIEKEREEKSYYFSQVSQTFSEVSKERPLKKSEPIYLGASILFVLSQFFPPCIGIL